MKIMTVLACVILVPVGYVFIGCLVVGEFVLLPLVKLLPEMKICP